MIADIVRAQKSLEMIKGISDELKENEILLKRLCERVSIFSEILKEVENQARSNGHDSAQQRSVQLLARLLAEIETFLVDFRMSNAKMFGSDKKMLFEMSYRNQIISDIKSFNQRVNNAVHNLRPSRSTDAEEQRRLDTDALKKQLDCVSEDIVNELFEMKGNAEMILEFIEEMKNDSANMKTEILVQIIELEKKLIAKKSLKLKDLGGLEEVLLEEKEEFKVMLEERYTQFETGLKDVECLISEIKAGINKNSLHPVTILNSLTILEQKVVHQTSVSLKEFNDFKSDCNGMHQDLLINLEQKLLSLDLLSVKQDLKELKNLVSMLHATSDVDNCQLRNQLKFLMEKVDTNMFSSISRKDLNEVSVLLSIEDQELMKFVEDKLQALDLLSIHQDMKEMKSLLDELKERADTKDEKLQEQLMTLEQLLISNQNINEDILESLKEGLEGECEAIFEQIALHIDSKFQSVGNVGRFLCNGFESVTRDLRAIRNLLDGKYICKRERKELLTRVSISSSLKVRYNESQLLGMGGFGNVYLGHYDTTKVAIKSLKSINGNELEAMENEVLIMNYLGAYPSIPTCYGIWADQLGAKFIVLEYCPYGSLAELLYDRENFPEIPIRLQMGWALDLVSVIAFIHEKNVKHEDIKADNLLVFGELKVKLCDFRLSNQRSSDGKSSLLGARTDAFMAPEVRTRGVSFASDIYSWAMAFYQIVMRKIPAVSVARVELIESFMTYAQDELPGEDLTGIKGLLNDCVQESPELRPTALYVKGKLSDFLENIGGDPRQCLADEESVSKIENKLKEEKKSRSIIANPIPSSSSSIINATTSVPFLNLTPDESNENNDRKAPLKSLDFQEAVELLIHLGCPDDVEQLLQERRNTEKPLNGRYLYFITTAEEFMTECALKDISMNVPDARKLFADLNEVKKRGISQSLITQLRQNSTTRIVDRALSVYNGVGVETDREKAKELFREATELGSEEGKYWLTILFKEIEEKDHVTNALEWVKLKAEKGSSFHMHGLGQCYDNGKGTVVDKKKAFQWVSKAAEKGHVNAMYNLGLCYDYGEGISVDVEKAFEWFSKAAEKGHVNAMYNLGLCYRNGDKVPVNEEKVFEWHSKAAEEGHVDAMDSIGYCYDYGEGVSEDKEKAFEWYSKAAEKGSVNAMYNLGLCYRNGDGVPVNEEKVFEWHLKSAEIGHVDAMYNLGLCYDRGTGVPVDKEKAFEWYLKAAENGHVDGMVRLGYCYDYGKGVSVNEEKAFEWYLKAAENGHVDGMVRLGYCYDYGTGVPVNKEKAFEWFLKAAESGHVDAMDSIGYCYDYGEGVSEYKEKAFEWYSKAAEKGSVNAMYNLGLCYRNGDGVPVNEEKAFEWHLKSAEIGHVDAMYNLGLCYDYGEGVSEYKEKAFEWYSKAAETGHVDAMYSVGLCYDRGTGVPVDKVKAFEWYLKAGEKGNVDAMYNSGTCYELGLGVVVDKYKAFEWYLKAAEIRMRCADLAFAMIMVLE